MSIKWFFCVAAVLLMSGCLSPPTPMESATRIGHSTEADSERLGKAIKAKDKDAGSWHGYYASALRLGYKKDVLSFYEITLEIHDEHKKPTTASLREMLSAMCGKAWEETPYDLYASTDSLNCVIAPEERGEVKVTVFTPDADQAPQVEHARALKDYHLRMAKQAPMDEPAAMAVAFRQAMLGGGHCETYADMIEAAANNGQPENIRMLMIEKYFEGAYRIGCFR